MIWICLQEIKIIGGFFSISSEHRMKSIDHNLGGSPFTDSRH
jgi:hypothetical protein